MASDASCWAPLFCIDVNGIVGSDAMRQEEVSARAEKHEKENQNNTNLIKKTRTNSTVVCTLNILSWLNATASIVRSKRSKITFQMSLHYLFDVTFEKKMRRKMVSSTLSLNVAIYQK